MHPSDYLWWAGNDVADVEAHECGVIHICGVDAASCSEEVGTPWPIISHNIPHHTSTVLAPCPHPHCWSGYLQRNKSYHTTYVAHTQMPEQPYLPHTEICIPVIQCGTRTSPPFTPLHPTITPHPTTITSSCIPAPAPKREQKTSSGETRPLISPGVTYGTLCNALPKKKKESSQHSGWVGHLLPHGVSCGCNIATRQKVLVELETPLRWRLGCRYGKKVRNFVLCGQEGQPFKR